MRTITRSKIRMTCLGCRKVKTYMGVRKIGSIIKSGQEGRKREVENGYIFQDGVGVLFQDERNYIFNG